MVEMLNNLRKLGILIGLLCVLLLGLAAVAVSYIDVGLTEVVGEEENVQAVLDLSQIPQSVIEDARALAHEMYGDYQGSYNAFFHQLLSSYVEVKEKDVVLIFNPGGWGSKLLEDSPGWYDIANGIRAELSELGYSSLVVDYRRTGQSFRGVMSEFAEVLRQYPSKTRNLASRVEFLARNDPGLKIIVAGESNGSIISDRAMTVLRDNPSVYSIQTGPPFWHRQATLDRTLILNDNGITPDSFSRGDVVTVVWTSLKALFGFTSNEEEEPGRILYFLRAPGHDYRWQYPVVYSEITQFLHDNFGIKADTQFEY
jgi:hypothetical protein